MNPWYAKAAVLAGAVVMVAIRAPHVHRGLAVKVVKSRKGALETALPHDTRCQSSCRSSRSRWTSTLNPGSRP